VVNRTNISSTDCEVLHFVPMSQLQHRFQTCSNQPTGQMTQQQKMHSVPEADYFWFGGGAPKKISHRRRRRIGLRRYFFTRFCWFLARPLYRDKTFF
jgi:hypothetical protein